VALQSPKFDGEIFQVLYPFLAIARRDLFIKSSAFLTYSENILGANKAQLWGE
jgi:hypothetical protein